MTTDLPMHIPYPTGARVKGTDLATSDFGDEFDVDMADRVGAIEKPWEGWR